MNEKIPLDQVLKDMYDPYSAAQSSARDYYYINYATDEERQMMDREDKINTIIGISFMIFLVIAIIGSLIYG